MEEVLDFVEELFSKSIKTFPKKSKNNLKKHFKAKIKLLLKLLKLKVKIFLKNGFIITLRQT
jgi:hypothetical protein